MDIAGLKLIAGHSRTEYELRDALLSAIAEIERLTPKVWRGGNESQITFLPNEYAPPGVVICHPETSVAIKTEYDRLKEVDAAARGVLAHVEGSLPSKGWLRDNDRSRAALGKLSGIVSHNSAEKRGE